MLFLRAFPLSVAILWRYLLVLPILVVALFVFAFIAVIFAFLVGFVAPFLMVLFIFAFALASGVIPVLFGMRVGLQAREVRPRNSFAALMLPAIGYGFFEALFVMIIAAACVALFVLLTPLGLSDLMALTDADDVVIFNDLFAANPMLTLACVFIGSGLVVALRTALLVPFAGASIGADPDGHSHTPFYGFGDGFWALFVLVIISYIGMAMAVPLVTLTIAPFGIADRLSEAAASNALDGNIGYAEYYAVFGTDGLIFIGMCTVLFLFFFSLQCAGAVLVYMQRLQNVVVIKQERSAERAADLAELEVVETPVQSDMMELVRSRMQNRRE